MSNSDGPVIFYHLEQILEPVTPDGISVLSGWMFAGQNDLCCGIRGGSGESITCGIYGLPRPDVATTHANEPQALFSGFRVELIARGRQSIWLEWMDESGRWHEFWRNPAQASKCPRTRSNGRPLLRSTHTRGLLSTLALETESLGWRGSLQTARKLILDLTSRSTPLPTCSDSFSHLDEPSSEFYSKRFIPVSGWIFNRAVPIRRIFAHAIPAGSVYLIFPKARPDVASAYPNLPVPEKCGFQAMVMLPSELPASFHLRIYAESDRGTTLVISHRYFRRHDNPPEPSRARAAILLGTLAFAGVYRPEAWLSWLHVVAFQRRSGQMPRPEKRKGIVAINSSHSSTVSTVVSPNFGPLISILVPVFDTPERYLHEMIASVQAQSYSRWELCLADDASTLPHVRPLLAHYARSDSRIRPIYRPVNGHISRATNSALDHARGEFVALLDHDDLLAPDALRRVVEAMHDRPDAAFFYTNRDKIDDQGRRFDPENRGAWNPAAALTHNYLHHLTVIRRNLVVRAGAFRADYFGSQDLDLYLRCHELLRSDQIVYVPFIAYHWRSHAGSTASRGDQKDYMFDSARRAIGDAIQRRGLRASCFLPDFGHFFGMNLHQLRWDHAILRDNPVSIVVATSHHQREQWQRSVRRLRDTIPAGTAQIIVAIAGGFEELPMIEREPDFEIVVAAHHTSLAELYNLGAARARNRSLLLIEAGIDPGSPGWLEDLAGWLGLPGVSAVGPKLVGSDGLVASAGWTIDHQTHLPIASSVGEAVADLIPPFLAHSARDSLLLDRACLLTDTAVFRALGGYDHRHFPESFFAADFCLRLHAKNHRVIFTPQATLVRTASHAITVDERELFFFEKYHHGAFDPWICPVPSAIPDLPHKNWMPAGTIKFDSGWFFLERPYPGEEIHAGHQTFSGWCFGQSGKVIDELVVRIGAHSYPVDFGEPRPDLSAKITSNGKLFPAGFTVQLGLPPGPAQLQFDAYVTGIGWEPVCVVDLEIQPRYAPTRPPPVPSVTDADFADSLELLVKKTIGAPKPLLSSCARSFARDAAHLPKRRHAIHPFQGYVDQPALDTEPFYSEINILGWLFHETKSIRRVVASFHLSQWVELEHHNESPLIARRFPDHQQAVRCGIFGRVPVPQDRPPPLSLRIWAETEEGEWHLVFTLRGRMHALGLTDFGTLRGAKSGDLAWATLTLRLAYVQSGARGPGWQSLYPILKELRRRIPPRALPRTRPARTSTTIRPVHPHLLFVSHNLNREGAPLFLLELAKYCRLQLDGSLTLVSPTDGPLRAEFEALGARVEIIDRRPLWSARTTAEAEVALTLMAERLRMAEASVVVANTIESFWAVQLAERACRPSLFYIHEPAVLGVHYLKQLAIDVRRDATLTLAQATCVSFLNRATLSYYLDYSDGANYRIQPGWTQLAHGLRKPEPAVRDRLRSRLGFANWERVVVNVGSVCPRKGQLVFVQAVAHLWRTNPTLASQCRFLLIGAHDNPYAVGLRALIVQTEVQNVEFLAPTDRIEDYYRSANLFVLSSFEEGFSRVLLEAMAFELPIIATEIHGIPEITRHEQEALMVPAGDAPAMAVAMQRLLQDEAFATQLGRAARLRLEDTFTADRVMPQHLDTLRSLAPDLTARVAKLPQSAA